jgi:hypothetical protein
MTAEPKLAATLRPCGLLSPMPCLEWADILEVVQAWNHAFVMGHLLLRAGALASRRMPAHAVGKELLLFSAHSFNVQKSWK